MDKIEGHKIMPWQWLYMSYDNDALSTLSNHGLVRRALKDVENSKISWKSRDSDSGLLQSDGQEVYLDGQGVPTAYCSCPARGICKHIIAAVIWVREQAAANVDFVSGQHAQDPVDDLLMLDLQGIMASLPIDVIRKAATLQGELIQSPLLRIETNSLIINLPDLNTSVKYIPGGGLPGMVSDIPAKIQTAVHIAALVSVWKEKGKAVTWPKRIEQDSTPIKEAGLGPTDKRVIDQVSGLLIEIISLGLAHVSPISAQRLQVLSLSARVEGIPRLSSMLRTLSQIIVDMTERGLFADHQALLSSMSEIFAWCEAYRHSSGQQLDKLKGTNRRDYLNQFEEMELLPLGAWWWSKEGGPRGLSLALWNPRSGEILQAVNARPNSLDTQFTAQSSWQAYPILSGTGTAAMICESSIILEQYRISEDDRLALSGDSRGRLLNPWSSKDPRLAELGVKNWGDLHSKLANTRGLMANRIDCLFLRPKEVAPELRLDELKQEFILSCLDEKKQHLEITLPCSPEYAHQVEVLEQLLANRSNFVGILVRIVNLAFGFRLEPVSVMTIQDSRVKVVVLQYANVPKSAAHSSVATRAMNYLQAQKFRGFVSAGSPLTFMQRLLFPIIEILEAMSVTGRFVLTDPQRKRLSRQNETASESGLSLVKENVDHVLCKSTSEPEAILRLYYMCSRLIHLGDKSKMVSGG